MIVERGHVGLIRSGRRTQTRLLVDGREPGYRRRNGKRGQSHQLVRPRRPRVGDRIPIQRREVDGDGRVTVTTELHVVAVNVRGPLPAGSTTVGDALACGYQTLTGWKAAWVRDHGQQWVARERVRQQVRHAAASVGYTVQEGTIREYLAVVAGDPAAAAEALRFDLDAGKVPDAEPRADDAPDVLATLTVAQLVARFEARHAAQPIWVVDHVISSDEQPRLLAARPGSTGGDYVTSPAAAMSGVLDPGEAVDPESLAKLNERDVERRDLEAKQRWLALRAQWEKGIRELEALGELTPEQRKQLDRLRHQLKGGDRRFIEEAA